MQDHSFKKRNERNIYELYFIWYAYICPLLRVRVGRESDVPMVCLLRARRGHHALLHYILCKLHNILLLLGVLKTTVETLLMKSERQDLKGYKYPTTRSKVIKIICRCTFDLRPLLSYYNKRIKTMNKEWITTAELIAYLKAHPDDEKECRLYLGHRLGSTHYWYWDAQKRTFMHTRDWPFSPISESEVMEWYGNSKWKIEQ